MIERLVFREVSVLDGSGGAPFLADVSVVGELIERVGQTPPGTTELDGRGLCLAPGLAAARSWNTSTPPRQTWSCWRSRAWRAARRFPSSRAACSWTLHADECSDLPTLVARILAAPGGERTLCITFTMCDEDLERNLVHPRSMIGSDGLVNLTGKPHPRLFGTFPRVLAEYVRRRRLLTLPEAVRKMTRTPCERFGLAGRGRVEEGMQADLVLFDAERVTDVADYDEPMRTPRGIQCVVVNGAMAYRSGVISRAGRVLKPANGAAT